MVTNLSTPAQPLAAPLRCATASVVLTIPDRVRADTLSGALRRLGSTVQRAESADDARRLIHDGVVNVVVLATDLGDESAWLTCAKLRWSHPEVCIVLLGPNSARGRRLAEFVGAAALLPDADSVINWFRHR